MRAIRHEATRSTLSVPIAALGAAMAAASFAGAADLSTLCASHVWANNGSWAEQCPAAQGDEFATLTCPTSGGGTTIGIAEVDFGSLKASATATTVGLSCRADATATFNDQIVVVASGLSSVEVGFSFGVQGAFSGPSRSCVDTSLNPAQGHRAHIFITIDGVGTRCIDDAGEIGVGVVSTDTPFLLNVGQLYNVTVTFKAEATSGGGSEANPSSAHADFQSDGNGVTLLPLVVTSGGQPVASARARGASCHQYLGLPPAVDGVLRVDADARGSGDGTTWADAVPSLQDALLLSKLPCGVQSIWIASGTYVPGTAPTSTFVLVANVPLIGGFAGFERSPEERDIQANPTVLSGDVNGDDGPGFTHRDDNVLHVVRAQLVGCCGISTTLDGLTIRGGHADVAAGEDQYGGGLHSYGGSLTIRNCRFVDNFATTCGAGFSQRSFSPNETVTLIEDSSFEGNFVGGTLSGAGGGVHIGAGAATVRRCTFSANTARPLGGGIHASGLSLLVDACNFVGNVASRPGNNGAGGAISTSCPTTCVDSEFSGNRAWGGGAISFASNPLTVQSCAFVGNAADLGDSGAALIGNGGAILSSNGAGATMSITSSSFAQNLAKSAGGAIYAGVASSTHVISQCDFAGNKTTLCGDGGFQTITGGGAIRALGSTLVERTTFIDNQSRSSGGAVNGAIYVRSCRFHGNRIVNDCGGSHGHHAMLWTNNVELSNSLLTGGQGGVTAVAADQSLQIVNSTIAGNAAAALVTCGGQTISLRNSIVWGNAALLPTGSPCGGGTGGVSAQFSDVQGGVLPGPGNFSINPQFGLDCDEPYALGARSPCIDVGSNALVPAWMTTDLRGAGRIAGAPPTVDMGAFEWHGPICVVGDVTGDGVVDGADLASMLGMWGACAGCDADLDGDGDVDAADLAILLGNWGGG